MGKKRMGPLEELRESLDIERELARYYMMGSSEGMEGGLRRYREAFHLAEKALERQGGRSNAAAFLHVRFQQLRLLTRWAGSIPGESSLRFYQPSWQELAREARRETERLASALIPDLEPFMQENRAIYYGVRHLCAVVGRRSPLVVKEYDKASRGIGPGILG